MVIGFKQSIISRECYHEFFDQDRVFRFPSIIHNLKIGGKIREYCTSMVIQRQINHKLRKNQTVCKDNAIKVTYIYM